MWTEQLDVSLFRYSYPTLKRNKTHFTQWVLNNRPLLYNQLCYQLKHNKVRLSSLGDVLDSISRHIIWVLT